MRKNFFLAVIFLLASADCFADHGGRGHGGFPGLEEKYFWKSKFLLKNQEELGLSEEQTQKLSAGKFDLKRALIETQAQKDLAMLDIERELHSDKPNREKINAAIDKKIEAERLASRAFAEGLVNIQNILTPEQAGKTKELHRKGKFSGSSDCPIDSGNGGHKGRHEILS